MARATTLSVTLTTLESSMSSRNACLALRYCCGYSFLSRPHRQSAEMTSGTQITETPRDDAEKRTLFHPITAQLLEVPFGQSRRIKKHC